ncbi:hypothetical protein DSC45_04760 [Streptomyces sp. YIM 130001]|uniref:hypothetical protein n=1 Tax=Streptomyces sp. YIM 130001 TaxID=2259644 RepID=UPI000E656FB4|nr:hypothetical protein [Streptomyces sp. YIM 130001]RII20518.1 hypothetical protein DSC45_04760 [Streptomyces sp. YIM 130001]
MSRRALDATEQAEICAEIGQVLGESLPDGWAQATLRWSELAVGGSSASLAAVAEDGSSLAAAGIPQSITKLCRQLRVGMYTETGGTWFTLIYTLVPERYSVRYDYDNEPDAPSFTPENYARDLAYFPRAEENVPDWLRKKLDGLPNVYGAVYPEADARDGVRKPSLEEFAAALSRAGWETGASDQFRGELAFSTDWARLGTLSRPDLIRFAGQADPERWDELHSLLTGFGWNVGLSCYGPRGGELVREFPTLRETGR